MSSLHPTPYTLHPLNWEAIRQVPEGGVYACVRNRSDADALVELAAALPETMQPIIFTASVAQIPAMLASLAPNVQFDSIIGRNVLVSELDKGLAAQILAQLLPHSVKLILSETVPRHTQRFYRNGTKKSRNTCGLSGLQLLL